MRVAAQKKTGQNARTVERVFGPPQEAIVPVPPPMSTQLFAHRPSVPARKALVTQPAVSTNNVATTMHVHIYIPEIV